MKRSLAWRCMGLFFLAATSVGAQEFSSPAPLPGAPPEVRSVFSSNRRFLVSGFPAASAANLMRWAEDVSRQLENRMGPMPSERGWYVEIHASSGDVVVRAQGWADGFLQQRLDIPSRSALDEQDALEGLVWLLLNRWPVNLQSNEQRLASLAVVPDWLAAGMAAQLYPQLLRRGAATALERWRTGTITAWPVLVEREILPAGRWSEKAEAALVVSWMIERRVLWDELWQSVAKGQHVTAGFVAQRVAGFQGVDEAIAHWDAWLALQQEKRRDPGSLDLKQVDEFAALTKFDAAELKSVQSTAQPPLSFAGLIEDRRTRWAIQLAIRRAMQIKLAMATRAPEWQDTAELYIRFLESITGRSKGYTGGFFGSGPSARQLRKLLAAADESLGALKREVSAREEFLDRAEAARAEGLDPEVQRFLDEAEQRR